MHHKANLFSAAIVFPLLLWLVLQGGSCRGGGTNSAAANGGNANTPASTNRNGAPMNGDIDSPSRNRAGETATANRAEGDASLQSGGKDEAGMEHSGERDTTRGDDAGGGSTGGGNSSGKSVAAGSWGGNHVSLHVTASGATVEYDCAHGTIQKMTLDAAGRFDVQGTHTTERGGPIRADEEAKGQPARYIGRVEGKTMTLRVVLTGTNQTVGTFTLTHGSEGRVVKCL